MVCLETCRLLCVADSLRLQTGMPVDVSTGADSLRSQNDMSGHVSTVADRLCFETGMTADVSSVADWLHVKFQSPIR